MDWKKGIITGIAAGVLLIMLSFVAMLNPEIGEWYQEIFPQMMNPTTMMTGPISSFIIGLVMGLIYSIINNSIPGKGVGKGIRYGVMIWLLGLMWPIMMMSFAPTNIWVMELLTGFIIYIIVGAVISLIYQRI